MGSVYRKSTTRKLPDGAEIITRKGERIAKWKNRDGKTRTAPLTEAGDRIRDESSTWYAKYRDGQGIIIDVPTGCRDETAARQILAELERKAERVRAGLITPAESRTAEHLATPIGEHFSAYLNALAASGSVPMHRNNVRTYLSRLADDCGFRRLADLKREALERWLALETNRGRSARSRNTHRAALIAFANWCADPTVGRLSANPFKGVPKADEKADRRRQRRAMTADELSRLLDVARRRPLLDALTVRRGKLKGQAVANLTIETRERLEALGRERALIYKTLVLTGLRKNELATLTVGQLRLDGPTAYADLDAADEKSREGNAVPIRADLADDIGAWLADSLAARQDEARRRFQPIPTSLPPDTPLFVVPAGLVRILDRDLHLAGIPKRDDRGRTLDVHALRTTFGTLLSRGGVALRTAQAAMRHSDPKLTANVYTDPRLLDIHGALDSLPSLSLNVLPDAGRDLLRATGTEIHGLTSVAPTVALTWCNESQSASIAGNKKAESPNSIGMTRLGEIGCFSGEIAGFQGVAAIPSSVCPAGFEPATSSSGG